MQRHAKLKLWVSHLTFFKSAEMKITNLYALNEYWLTLESLNACLTITRAVAAEKGNDEACKCRIEIWPDDSFCCWMNSTMPGRDSSAQLPAAQMSYLLVQPMTNLSLTWTSWNNYNLSQQLKVVLQIWHNRSVLLQTWAYSVP